MNKTKQEKKRRLLVVWSSISCIIIGIVLVMSIFPQLLNDNEMHSLDRYTGEQASRINVDAEIS
ncbi:putative membrane protein [Natronobacillus azotifigens]|uniref:Uncharacterized protein n=1 Tax=Natronobacillus azotifigens TaxID=472978 RepID=A0A9J6RDT6_9BACI|nr:hypothetical protein [Natronobacillus azotifigens]MCZ0703832.1 hypothetical protein [Natronobacillus azotifigens]